VEFFVRAELIRDISTVSDKLSGKEKRFFIMPGMVGDLPSMLIGLRGVYAKDWGFSGRFMIGKLFYNTTDRNSDSYKSFSVGLDLTKRIINGKNFQMHLMAGLATMKLLLSSSGLPGRLTINLIMPEGGILMAGKTFAFSFGLAAVSENKTLLAYCLFCCPVLF
ncbi:MAG: hypothetical protein C0408_07920, partial [Odoribacter sp.]|nr:hypothetical protein [Odoribacter sp.]